MHLTRLGYEYLSLKDTSWDENTNIFKDFFIASIKNINQNKNLKDDEILKLYDNISLLLENDDLGKAFYERLTEKSGIKLIDFENFSANKFNVVTREITSSYFLFVSLNSLVYSFTTLWLIFKALAIFLLDSLASHFSRKISLILHEACPWGIAC